MQTASGLKNKKIFTNRFGLASHFSFCTYNFGSLGTLLGFAALYPAYDRLRVKTHQSLKKCRLGRVYETQHKTTMRSYIRAKSKGGVYFFTVNLARRNNNDLLIKHISILRDAFRNIKHRQPFDIDAIVILPEHLHCIWTLPENDDDFSTRWRLIKSHFSRQLSPNEWISNSRKLKKERGIWQRRYWEHLIRDDDDYQRHLDYIHYNPVKHGYVEQASDWPHSTFKRWVKRNVYPLHWAAGIEVRKQNWE